MKNLKLFVFSLCLMLVAVLSVNALNTQPSCVFKPGESDNTCGATRNGVPYGHASDAVGDALDNGGEVTLYGSYTLANGNANYKIEKNVTINMYEDNVLYISDGTTGVLNVENGATLTINANKVEIKKDIVVRKGGKLVINAKDVTTNNSHVATVAGTVVVSANTTLNVVGKTAFIANPGADITLNGTFKGTSVVAPGSAAPAYGEAAAKVTVNSGTYTTTTNAIVADKGMNVIINGGTFNANAGTTTKYANVIELYDAVVTINGGTLSSNGAVVQTEGTADTAALTINGGTLVATAAGRHALLLKNAKATYALAGGTYESKGDKDSAAIDLEAAFFDTKTGELIADQKNIITGGKYLNKIVAAIRNVKTGANYDPTDDLVAEGYEVKEEGKYKVVVKTGATDVEPEKQPDATKPGSTGSEELPPDTYDAGLAYMGLALAAVGASVVSIKKLRNN